MPWGQRVYESAEPSFNLFELFARKDIHRERQTDRQTMSSLLNPRSTYQSVGNVAILDAMLRYRRTRSSRYCVSYRSHRRRRQSPPLARLAGKVVRSFVARRRCRSRRKRSRARPHRLLAAAAATRLPHRRRAAAAAWWSDLCRTTTGNRTRWAQRPLSTTISATSPTSLRLSAPTRFVVVDFCLRHRRTLCDSYRSFVWVREDQM